MVVLAAFAGISLAGSLCIAPLRQDPAYHIFADQRTILRCPHALNVISNLPFVVVGGLGLYQLRRPEARARGPWIVFMASILLTGFGSAYYHVAPSDATLFWDRLPMALGFSSILAILIRERVDGRWGRRLFLPLLAAGVASLLYGHPNDLRFYGLLQFWAVGLSALILVLFPSSEPGTGRMVAALALYAAAKLFEVFDLPIYRLGHVVSGHTLKHLAAALGAWQFVRLIQERRPEEAKSVDARPEPAS